MLKREQQLVHGVRPEGVAHLGTVEGDPHHTRAPGLLAGAVVGDVGEVEAGHLVPKFGFEGVGGCVVAHELQGSGRPATDRRAGVARIAKCERGQQVGGGRGPVRLPSRKQVA